MRVSRSRRRPAARRIVVTGYIDARTDTIATGPRWRASTMRHRCRALEDAVRDHQAQGCHSVPPAAKEQGEGDQQRGRRGTRERRRPHPGVATRPREEDEERAEQRTRGDRQRDDGRRLDRIERVVRRRKRHDRDRRQGQPDPDERRHTRPLTARQRIDDRNGSARDGRDRRDQTDQSAPHRAVEEREPERDDHAARERPFHVVRGDLGRADGGRDRHRQEKRDQLRRRRHPHRRGAPRRESAEEVGAAREERRREREKRRQRLHGCS